jgi:hypothetical protein
MYRELYQYLIINQQLQIPGIGSFQVEREPARLDFPNRAINAPAYSVSLQPSSEIKSRHLYNWLADLLHVSDRDAVVRFHDFAFEMKKQLNSGDVIVWNGIGSLSKDLSGDIKLVASPVDLVFNKSVTAEKVLREKAEHFVRVGEDQRTSAEMTEMLALPEAKRSYWWAVALAIGIITIIFIGWYLSEHGVDSLAISNKQKLQLKDSSAFYRELNNQ